MSIKLKNDIPVCQRARRLCLFREITVLCKKANGAMKTSSVEFISRSPNPLPMKSKHHRFVLLQRIFRALAVEAKEKRNRFEQTSRTLQRKISMRSTKRSTC
ncbi:hypothetical protein TNCV_3146511 [Trichonephila clavipes]|nr:hypothetical protein TNCV_3146511 [Trichonephila clavipes]